MSENLGQHLRFIFKYPKTTATLFLLLVIFFLDFVTANMYRAIYGMTPFPALNAQAVERSYRVKSDIYHHDLKKNVLVKNAVWGRESYQLSTDSLGFKSNGVNETPIKTNRHRILFIGDSFTEGIGVPYEDTFVGLIGKALRTKNIDVLNAAVSSYSPIIYWRKIKYLIEDVGLKFDEVVVYIDMSDIEDEAVYYRLSNTNTVVDGKKDKKSGFGYLIKDWFKRNSILLNVGQLPIIQARNIDRQEAMINISRARWTIDNDLYNQYGKRGLAEADKYMELLYRLLSERHIKLTIAVYPWPDQIMENDVNSIQVTYWRKWSKDRNICFINHFPEFVKVGRSKSENLEIIRRYYLIGDVHWNKEGHRVIADKYLVNYPKSCIH